MHQEVVVAICSPLIFLFLTLSVPVTQTYSYPPY